MTTNHEVCADLLGCRSEAYMGSSSEVYMPISLFVSQKYTCWSLWSEIRGILADFLGCSSEVQCICTWFIALQRRDIRADLLTIGPVFNIHYFSHVRWKFHPMPHVHFTSLPWSLQVYCSKGMLNSLIHPSIFWHQPTWNQGVELPNLFIAFSDLFYLCRYSTQLIITMRKISCWFSAPIRLQVKLA